MADISVTLPTDSGSPARRFNSVQRKLPAGKVTAADANYAATSTVEVAANGDTALSGARTYVQPAAITVTTTSTLVLSGNAARLYALIQNDGAVTVYLNIAGGSAVAGRGIRLAPNGGSYELGAKFGNLMIGNITAIVASGTSTTMATEGT